MDVYQRAIEFLALVTEIVEDVPRGHAERIDQLVRSAESVVRNIAEAAGRWSPADVAKHYEIARGEAMERASSMWKRRPKCARATGSWTSESTTSSPRAEAGRTSGAPSPFLEISPMSARYPSGASPIRESLPQRRHRYSGSADSLGPST
ncbi:MAG TPA: four helix bundle protein [Sandaracinaceae bacterium LLY-WYZ-13_1]|nr:four helix bundle protein [Sandaracinaceae bacterium LLY-WYZ-13_1]